LIFFRKENEKNIERKGKERGISVKTEVFRVFRSQKIILEGFSFG